MNGVGLEVRSSNQAAQALYHSLGFKPIASRRRYYHNTGEDALVLALSWGPENHW